MRTNISFQHDNGKRVDSYDANVPRIGTYFSHWSSKDELGNYHPKGELREVFGGIVYAVEQYLTEFGSSVHNASVAGFIRVRIRNLKDGEVADTSGPEMEIGT